jgi:hypothetical protein
MRSSRAPERTCPSTQGYLGVTDSLLITCSVGDCDCFCSLIHSSHIGDDDDDDDDDDDGDESVINILVGIV